METEKGTGRELRELLSTPEFDAFFDALPVKVQEKFKYVFHVVANVHVLPVKFVKRLQNTDLYELRVAVGTNEYRSVIFAIDSDNIIESTKIILLNGFLKKSTKDYRKNIEQAQAILNQMCL